MLKLLKNRTKMGENRQYSTFETSIALMQERIGAPALHWYLGKTYFIKNECQLNRVLKIRFHKANEGFNGSS